MAAVHFIVIIIYHIINYVHNGVIRNKTEVIINVFIVLTTNNIRNKSRHQQFHLKDNIRNNIPEVAYRYDEYREPLVGQEC